MERPVQPAVFGRFHAGRAGFHVVLRIEVRARGVGRAGGVNDRQVALLPQRLEGRERWVQPEESVEIEDRVARNLMDGRMA